MSVSPGRSSDVARPSVARRDENAVPAVVLSGGGAKGAYEVGVLKALCSGASPATGFRPLEPEIWAGTSVGAYNAVFLAAHGDLPAASAVARLEEVWRDKIAESPGTCGNGVFRMRGNPLELLEPGCLQHPEMLLRRQASDFAHFVSYAVSRGMAFLASSAPLPQRVAGTVDVAALFTVEPLWELLESTVDLDRLRRSPAKVTVVATDWSEGGIRTFDKEALTDGVGLVAVRAATAIPGLFPPVEIEGRLYVDGAVLRNTPLRPAIRGGATACYAIYLDPLISSLPLPALPNTADTLYRLYAVAVAGRFNADIARTAEINREIELLRRLGVGADAGAALAPVSRVFRRRQEGGPAFRPVTVHRFRPPGDLGGLPGIFDFRSRFIDDLIARGYRDAVEYDPETTSILPARPATLLRADDADAPRTQGGEPRTRDDRRPRGHREAM